nr:immunoglobulin light chain junction region [Macaca mulatta]
CGSYAGSNVLF